MIYCKDTRLATKKKKKTHGTLSTGEEVMRVAMRNPKTGEIKEVKVGWSWTLFFFSGFFGLPLFLRGLHIWGAIFLVLWVVNLATTVVTGDAGALISVTLFVVFLGLEIFLGIKGNEMTAKNYLENDWTFVDPNSEITNMAKMRWGITV